MLLNLGLCNLRLNKRATALKWFRQAQLRAAERGQAETEAAAKRQTSNLAPIVPLIKIETSVALPAGAFVLLDGATVDRTSLSRVEVDAGPHTVAVSGAGLDPTKQTIEVPEQTPEPLVVTLNIRAAPSTVHGKTEHDDTPVDAQVLDRRRRRGWFVIVGGAAAAGTSLYFGLRARQHDADASAACPTRTGCSEEAVSASADAHRDANLANVFAGVALLGFGIGTYLVWSSHRVQVAPQVGSTHAGMSLSARF